MVTFEFGRGDPVRQRTLYDAYLAAGGPGRPDGDLGLAVAQLHHIGHRHLTMWVAARDPEARHGREPGSRVPRRDAATPRSQASWRASADQSRGPDARRAAAVPTRVGTPGGSPAPASSRSSSRFDPDGARRGWAGPQSGLTLVSRS